MVNRRKKYFMKYKLITSFVCTFFSLAVVAQTEENNDVVAVKKIEDPVAYLDSIKSTFITHPVSEKIDSRWIQELTNQTLFEEMTEDLTESNIDEGDIEYDGLSTELLKKRLSLLNEKTPFNVEYNESLERLIKSFLKKRKKSFERLIGLSEYYFPMFEEQLAKNDVPLEVKYLAIVESALNPTARSHMGATGLWQFMYATGKQYNLDVTSFVDDRNDPLKSSEAASKFLKDLYNIFGDWDLVLASYNAGPGNVSKAIRRSNGYTNYWNIRANLPRETQNYLPAFYATMYIFEYAKEHGISTKKAPFALAETDTIAIKKNMSFEQVSKLLDISEDQLAFLNPVYKLKKIPYVSGKQNFLRLPVNKIGLMTSNEDKIYAYIDFVDSLQEKPNFDKEFAIVESKAVTNKYHTIKKGESIGVIASKYGQSVAELKKMNNMKSSVIYPGKKLIVGKSTVSRATASSNNAFYTVQKGDSLYSISKKTPGATIDKLRAWNNMKENDGLTPGMKLRIN